MHYKTDSSSLLLSCPVGVARQLRRISTWSQWTRKSTSRSWRRTTTAWERAWGLCWRGRFLSSTNPSSGLGWRTGKQTHQVKQPILFWQEVGKKKNPTHHWSFHHSVWLLKPKGKLEQMELSWDPFTLSVSPLQILTAETEPQYTDWASNQCHSQIALVYYWGLISQ